MHLVAGMVGLSGLFDGLGVTCGCLRGRTGGSFGDIVQIVTCIGGF